ncbi:MAG: helix-turn-helix domain-containing protein, partial [Paraburkholderia sp.]|uniref:GlxA family transcriptional regulator n=1 Tax=Paraburkholderia sp. TaxID=1926495 RepID=UPI003978F738
IGRSHGAALASAVSEQFVVSRIRQRSDHQRMEITARYGVHNRKLIQVIGVMEQHMEEPLAPNELAREIGVTRRQLERLFCAALKDTPTHFYQQLRLNRARELLQQTDMSITSICVACGFESPSHFSRTYRARFGTTPRGDRHPLASAAATAATGAVASGKAASAKSSPRAVTAGLRTGTPTSSA